MGGVLIAAVVGILLASWLGITWGLLLGLIGCLLLLVPIYKQGGVIFGVAVVAFSLLQLWSWSDAPARKLALWFDAHPREFSVEGVVDGAPKVSSTGTMGTATFPIRVEKIADQDDTEPQLVLPAGLLGAQVHWPVVKDFPSPVYGDRVSFQAIPERPSWPRNPGSFDYRQWLERHGIYTQFSIDPAEPGKILSSGQGNPLMACALIARHRMETILSTDLEGAPREVSAIKGITLGVTENAPDGFTDDFRFTGTMHLFAVSGLHVGMLAVMIWFVLVAARLPRPWAVAIIIPMLFFYVAVTGLKSGSIRSATMVSLLLCGSVLYRRAPLYNTLAAAALLQLAWDPNALFSAGWQFSYSVVFAILAITPSLERRLVAFHSADPFIPPKLLTRRERWEFSGWKYLMGLLSVSTAAWIGSLLPTIAYFHLISFSAIGANLLAVPLAFVVLALGALSLLAGTFSLWVAGAFNNANWLIAKILLLVVQSSAVIPGGHWFIGPIAKPYPVITLFDLGGGSCAVVQRGREFALVNAGRKRDAERDILPFLESRGANSIKNLLLTKDDAAHLGGVPEIAGELKVKHLIFFSENSRSPVAKAVLKAFENSRTTLSAGITGPLLGNVTMESIALPGEEVGVRLCCGKIRVLFLPRLTPEISQKLLSKTPDAILGAEVLVMPLGGSELLSTQAVIQKVSPKYLVSSVNQFSRTGVPSREWEALLARQKILFLRQDKTGAVMIDADPKQMKVEPYVPQTDRAEADRSGAR
jgi:ComEC/Rec2-related protein